MKTIEIKHRYTGKVIFSCECESIKECLKNAIEKQTDLSGSDLEGSDLSGSNLEGTDLRGARTDKRYISVSCIGSAKRMTTYCFEDDTVWCGCFTGNLAQFEQQVNETHKDNPRYLKEYVGFINYLKSLI